MAHHASATAQKRKCPDPDEETAAGLCANRCGFFGAAATGGMCSKCCGEHAAATATTSVFFIAPAAPAAPPEKKTKTVSAAADTSPPSAMQDAPAANRCAACRKKVGLLGFQCRCEATFCSAHRYSDKHGCGFDYRTAGQEQIAKQNPVVVADKIAARI